MDIVFDFDNKMPSLNQSQIVIFNNRAMHPFFAQSILPFALNDCIDKPIIYVDEMGHIGEISIISTVGIENKSHGIIFSIFGDNGISSLRGNRGIVYDKFAIAYPDNSPETTVTVSQDNAIIKNDDVNLIIKTILPVTTDEDLINGIKMKYKWRAAPDYSIVVGTFR